MASRSEEPTMEPSSASQQPAKKQVLLSDAMLYLFAREAEKKGTCKLPMAEIYRIMSNFEADFKDLTIPITFEKAGSDVYSRRIDEAMYYLIPFDIQIVNPSFSIVLEKNAALRRLQKLDSRLPESAKQKLDLMFAKFDAELQPPR